MDHGIYRDFNDCGNAEDKPRAVQMKALKRGDKFSRKMHYDILNWTYVFLPNESDDFLKS